MHIDAWILLTLPCITKHILPHPLAVTPTPHTHKKRPINIKYLWHNINGFVKKITSY